MKPSCATPPGPALELKLCAQPTHHSPMHNQSTGFLPTTTTISIPSDTPRSVSRTAFSNSSRKSSCDPNNAVGAVRPSSSMPIMNSSVEALRISSMGAKRKEPMRSRLLDWNFDDRSAIHLRGTRRSQQVSRLAEASRASTTDPKSMPVFWKSSSKIRQSSSQLCLPVSSFGAWARKVAQSSSSHCRKPPGSTREQTHQRT